MERNKSGIEPKNIWIARRKKDLRLAIIELLNQYSEVPIELLEEYNEYCVLEQSNVMFFETKCGQGFESHNIYQKHCPEINK